MVLRSRQNCCDSDPISIRFRGDTTRVDRSSTVRNTSATFDELSSVGPSKSIIQSPYTHQSHHQFSPLNFNLPLSSYLGISRVRHRLSVFATSQINVCNAPEDPSFALRVVSDVNSTKYIGRQGGSGMVYRRATEGTPLTRFST